MREEYVTILLRALERVDSDKAEVRQSIYDRMHAALVRKYAAFDGGTSDPAYLEATIDLDDAIAEVDANFTKKPTGRVERAIGATTRGFKVIKLRYGALAGALAFFGDLLKPIFELTTTVLVGSLILGGALAVLRSFAGSMKAQVANGIQFCAVLFVCSATLFGLQRAVPNANANGVIAEVIPGASAVQDVILAALGRIERQTQRVGDLLEQQHKKAIEEENKLVRDKAGARQAVIDLIRTSGFSPDGQGYLLAIQNRDAVTVSYFKQLEIRPTEEDVVSALSMTRSYQQRLPVRNYLLNDPAFPFGRRFEKEMAGRYKKIYEAMDKGAEGLAYFCDPKNWYAFDASGLSKLCADLGSMDPEKRRAIQAKYAYDYWY